LKDRVIAPVESLWGQGSPLVPLAKKDGSIRWSIDYRELNRYTLPDAYPIPCLSQVVENIAGSKMFRSSDASQAFYNFPIEESYQDAIAFI